MPRFPKLPSAIVLILVLAVFAGCGGDDNGSDDSGGGAAAPADSVADRDSSDPGSNQGSSDEAVSTESDSGESDSGESSLTDREQFVEDANAICEKQTKRIEARTVAILAKAGEGNSAREEKAIDEALNDVIAPGFEQQFEEFRALGIPEGDEPQVEAIFDAMQKVVDEARADSTVFTEKIEPFERPEELAVAYGLGSCGSL